jgi:hypothetical protein
MFWMPGRLTSCEPHDSLLHRCRIGIAQRKGTTHVSRKKKGTFTVERDNDRPLRFTGRRIAVAKSSSDRNRPDYSGEVGISEAVALYQSHRGDYIATRTRLTQRQGDQDHNDAIVSSSKESIFEYLGFGRLAMEIYAAAEWDIAEDLDAVA